MEEDSEEKICRVCRGGEEEGNELYHPCLCKGSISYVHKECLMTWLSYASRTKCELCGFEFKLSPMYAPNTPNTLPMKEMILIALETMIKSMPSMIHSVLVCVCWIVSIPLSCRFTFRMCVFKDLWSEEEEASTIERLKSEWISGVNLASALLVSCLAIVTIVDYVFNRIVQEEGNERMMNAEEEAKVQDVDDEEKEEDNDFEDQHFNNLGAQNADGLENIENDPHNAIELRVALDEVLGFRRNAFMFLQNIAWAVMFIVVYMCAFVMMPMFVGVATVWIVRNVIETTFGNETIVSRT